MSLKISSVRKITGKERIALAALAVDPKQIAPAKSKKKSTAKALGAIDVSSLIEAAGPGFYERASREGFEGKPGQSILVHLPKGQAADAVLFFGKPASNGPEIEKSADYRTIGALIGSTARGASFESASLLAANLELRKRENALALLEGVSLGGYSFNRYKTSKENGAKKVLKEFHILGEEIPAATLVESAAAAEAVLFARDLVNTPPVDCAPRDVVAAAKEIAKKFKLKIQVLDERELKKRGAGGLLAVAKGSDEPPYMIRLVYSPKGKAKKKIALVGKGVTFDSGGLSIKTGAGMETMKCDMSGAAAVLGAMRAVGVMKPKVQVSGYIPTTENMINGKATRPGDVLKTLSGKTVEVLNTDAEGRLILADALCWAESDKPDMIVDLATLTGACMVALGSDYAGLFSSDDKLAARLMRASELAGESLWRMPLPADYRNLIKSGVADIKNVGGRYGGAITAALFLKEFVSKTPWAHIDLAGPAFNEGGPRGIIPQGGTGFGVRTLLRLIASI